MKTKKQKAREQKAPVMNVLKPAHTIGAGRAAEPCACDSCGERFIVDREELRVDGELEVTCPYCNRKMLVQHVEYAVAMVIE